MLTAYISSFPAGGETSSASIQGLRGPAVRARLESGPWAAAHSPLAERNGFLQLQLHDYTASFMMSSLRNLALFLEDDSASQVLPMEISIRDTHIDLKVKRLVRQCRTLQSLCFTPRLLLQNTNRTVSVGNLSHCFKSSFTNWAHNSLPQTKAPSCYQVKYFELWPNWRLDLN